MDKRKIDQDVYERYVDASVALFMECYCATLSEDIHRQVDQVQADDLAFPAALDVRCRSAIKKEYAVRKRKQSLKSIAKGLRYAASFAVVLLALASVLFISVEAIRVPIINYYIAQSDQYVEFTSRQQEAPDGLANINAEDPLAGLLPEGYELASIDIMSPNHCMAIYKSSDNKSISFSIYPSETVVRIDSENSQTVKEIQVCGLNGILIVKDGRRTITWGFENDPKTFMLSSSELPEIELINLAECFMQKIG